MSKEQPQKIRAIVIKFMMSILSFKILSSIVSFRCHLGMLNNNFNFLFEAWEKDSEKLMFKQFKIYDFLCWPDSSISFQWTVNQHKKKNRGVLCSQNVTRCLQRNSENVSVCRGGQLAKRSQKTAKERLHAMWNILCII